MEAAEVGRKGGGRFELLLGEDLAHRRGRAQPSRRAKRGELRDRGGLPGYWAIAHPLKQCWRDIGRVTGPVR